MKASQFDFQLPDGLVAAMPLALRDQSRLMRLNRHDGSIKDLKFAEISEHLSSKSLIILNDTRVLPARLHGRKRTGGAVELFLVRRIETGQETMLPAASSASDEQDSASQNAELWEAIGRNLVGLSVGEELTFGAGSARSLVARLLAHGVGGGVTVSLRAEPRSETVASVLAVVGEVPLPPYIEAARRRDGSSDTSIADSERYQTVYADEPGAVAAPTAGLHFTEQLLAHLSAVGHEIVKLTLHVGPGTFRPVKVDDVEDHVMDTEWYRIPPATAAAVEDARRRGRPVVAVGTTVVRALETAVRAGGGIVNAGSAASRLFLRPGDRFHVVTDLLTNFHLPRSTLLMLVCAFAGRERVLSAYQQAIARGYRFYSYGDAMLIRGAP